MTLLFRGGIPLLGLWIVPTLGWQYMFVIGAVPAVMILFLRRVLPESPRWLAATGRLADAETAPLRLRSVADLIAHPQIVGAVVQQENGEDPEVDDGANQLRRLVHDGLQVQGGVERVRQPHEEGELDRLGAHLCARRRAFAGGSIVALETLRRPVVGPILLAIILHRFCSTACTAKEGEAIESS